MYDFMGDCAFIAAVVAIVKTTIRNFVFICTFYPTWVNVFWQKYNPNGFKNVYPCEMPSIPGDKAHSYSGQYSAIFVIPKNARHKDEAIRFMKFIASGETATKWLKYSKSPTGLKTGFDFSGFGQDAYDVLYHHIKVKYNDRLEEADISKVLFNTSKNLDYHVEDVLSGQLSAGDALKLIKKQLKKIKIYK